MDKLKTIPFITAPRRIKLFSQGGKDWNTENYYKTLLEEIKEATNK
jgi:hypothetical protein